MRKRYHAKTRRPQSRSEVSYAAHRSVLLHFTLLDAPFCVFALQAPGFAPCVRSPGVIYIRHLQCRFLSLRFQSHLLIFSLSLPLPISPSPCLSKSFFSGNNFRISSPFALQIPLSVIKAVTYFAGVTSNP